MHSSKTYYWISRQTSIEHKKGIENPTIYTYELPPEFVASRAPKWIVIEQCKATMKNQLVGDVIMHSTFVHRDHYLDHAVCFVNEEANKDTAKYEYNSNISQYQIWFTDLNGDAVEMDSFVVRMLLIY